MWTFWNKVRQHLGKVFLVTASLILFGLGSLSWDVPRDRIESKLKAALQKESAYSLTSFRQARFQAFPWPVLDIQDLKLIKESAEQESLNIESLRIRLNLGSWLWGNPRIVEMRMTKPTVHFSSSKKLNETEAFSTIALNFLRSNKRPSLQAIRISNAQLLLDGKPWVQDIFINMQNVAMTDLRLRARARYNDVPISLNAEIQQGTSPEGRGINWKFDLPGLSSRFDGRLFGSRTFDADGYSQTDINDGEEYARGLGLSPDIARVMSKLALIGETKITWPNIQIRNAKLKLDQNNLDGSVEVTLDGKPRISATLGADKIDLNSRIAAWKKEFPSQPQNSPLSPVSFDWLHNAHADIRISAEQVLVDKMAFEKVALASQLRDGRLDVVISDAKLHSGTLRGRMQIRRVEQEIIARSSLQFDHIDIEAAQALIGVTRMKGLASGQFAFDTKGTTTAQLIENNEGKGNVSIRNGEFIGLDIERLLTRLDKTTQPIVAASGSTRFRSMSSNFILSSGVVSLSQSSFTTLGLTAPIEGTIDINQQIFDLRLRLQPLISIPRLSGAAIKITGPWSKPVFTPEMPQQPDRS